MSFSKPVSLLCALGIGIAGCATTPPPTNQLAVARDAVARADGTPEIVSLAPVEVERARTKVAAAIRAMSAREYEDARRLADEAEADARAAEARSQAVKNDRALVEVRRALDGLRAELARKG